MICSGWDPYKGFQIYSVNQTGFHNEGDFAMSGSGSIFIQGYFDANFTPDMTLEQAKAFIKKDGSERVLVGRLGVTSRLKGGTSTLDAEKYITIFDVQNDGYRAVNRDTIRSVRIDGEEYTA